MQTALLRERERRKTLILIHVIDYLQLRSIYIYTSLGELTTIHVTYIKKGKIVHYIYIIFNKYHSLFASFNLSEHPTFMTTEHNQKK